MKKTLMTAILCVLASASVFAGPFGLELGSSMDEYLIESLETYEFTIADKITGVNVFHLEGAFDIYCSAMLDSDNTIFEILCLMVLDYDMQDLDSTKVLYDTLASLLSNKYGEPTEQGIIPQSSLLKIFELLSGSWADPVEGMMWKLNSNNPSDPAIITLEILRDSSWYNSDSHAVLLKYLSKDYYSQIDKISSLL